MSDPSSIGSPQSAIRNRFASVLPCLAGTVLLFCCGHLSADDSPVATAHPPAQTWLLQYKFQPGETLRWQVTHKARVNTTVSGTTQTAETTSMSLKVWRVLAPDSAGSFRFEQSVEKVEMRQKLTGREEIVYNSETDQQPPPGFEDAASAVGVPLAVIIIDAHGNVIRREQKHPGQHDPQAQVTVPLPVEAVPIGHVWSYPYEVQVPLKNKQVREIKTRQQFTLVEVKNQIATISVETQILTPVHDAELEAQLIQRETAGTIRFDLTAGRIIEQQMDLDKSVIGFSGEASRLHYVMRFSEELLPATGTTAARVYGPTAPPTTQARAPATPPRRGQKPTSGIRRR